MSTCRTLARRVLVSVTAVSVVGAGSPGAGYLNASAPSAPRTFSSQSQIAPANADATARSLEETAKDIPRDTFDPLAIVNTVGKDRSALLAWVRDSTYWVPYRGALRGPTGVLMDRLGNSLDRSLLLAELLRLAGHSVRLAQGTLADQPAREALQRMRPVPANPVPQRVEDDATFQRVARQLGLDPQALRTQMRSEAQPIEAMKADLSKRVAAQAPFLMSQLGARPPAGDASAETLAAVRDHWWVQQRDGARWIDLDPMWPASREAAGSVSAARTFAFDRTGGEIPLPSEYTHEIILRVVVEQWKDGRVSEQTPLAHTFRPAETYGQPIVLQVAPLGWPKLQDIVKDPDPAGTLKAILVKQTEWLPSLTIGERAIRGSSFTDSGELNAKPGQSTGAARAAASMVDAFGGGEAESEGRLTAAWIEYETRVPGRPSSKVRRDLFDLLEHQPRSANAVADPAPDEAKRAARAISLATAVQLLPLSSRLSPEYVTSQAVAGVLRNREALLDMTKRAAAGDITGALGRAEGLKLTLNGQLLDLAHTRFEWSAARQDVYLDAPNILSYRTTLFQNASGRLATRQGFDVVTNGVAIRPGAAGDPFEIRLSQGTADTALEDLLMRGGTGNASALLAASGQPGAWVVLRGPADPGLSRLTLPADARARIADHLRRGYVVVAPGATAVAAAGGQVAWWRIDPKNGETLGIGPQGWGQSTAEYALFWFVSTMLIFAICMLVQVGPGQTPAQFGRNLAQCACVGFGGGFALTVALGGGGLAAGLFIASQAGLGCVPFFLNRPPAKLETSAGPASSIGPVPTCSSFVQPTESPG